MRVNKLGMVRTRIKRPDPADVARLSQFGVATIHEATGRVGLLRPYIRPAYPGAKLCGPAVTVLQQPGDNWIFHVTTEQVHRPVVRFIRATCDVPFSGRAWGVCRGQSGCATPLVVAPSSRAAEPGHLGLHVRSS